MACCLFAHKEKGGKDTPVFDIFLRIHSLERQNVPLEEILITEDEELEIKELAVVQTFMICLVEV